MICGERVVIITVLERLLESEGSWFCNNWEEEEGKRCKWWWAEKKAMRDNEQMVHVSNFLAIPNLLHLPLLCCCISLSLSTIEDDDDDDDDIIQWNNLKEPLTGKISACLPALDSVGSFSMKNLSYSEDEGSGFGSAKFEPLINLTGSNLINLVRVLFFDNVVIDKHHTI